MKRRLLVTLAILWPFSHAPCQETLPVSAGQDVRVECQASGPFEVRSYLVYDIRSKEAALIDAGSAVDKLMATVDAEALMLKYILLTHCHQDHVASVPALKEKYPKARLCFSREEFLDCASYAKWKVLFDAQSVAQWEANPAISKLMNCDYEKIPGPDLDLQDGQTLSLGGSSIEVITTPGHSRGSLTFAIANFLFPGDLLLYHSTGYINYPLCSKEDIVKSIRRLYAGFPDGTVIYSGHGEESTIGTEKVSNRVVTSDAVKWPQ